MAMPFAGPMQFDIHGGWQPDTAMLWHTPNVLDKILHDVSNFQDSRPLPKRETVLLLDHRLLASAISMLAN